MIKFIIMPNNKYTEEKIREAVTNSFSIAGMCRYLGIIPAGGNYASMKRRINRYDIDTSHFTGQGWNKGNYLDDPNHKIAVKKKIIRERGHQCERCKTTEWFEIPVTLELEHIDGNTSNNDEENLLLLCPNCHSQTKTWRRAKSSLSLKVNPKLVCPICGEPKQYKSKTCRECFQSGRSGRKEEIAETLRRPEKAVIENFCACGATITPRSKECMKCTYVGRPTKIVWPPTDDLVVRLRDFKESRASVATSLGVTSKSVSRYLLRNNIDPKTFLPLNPQVDVPE